MRRIPDKERVIVRLEGKSIYDLRDEYYRLENTIFEILSEKPNSGNECNCDRGDDDWETIKAVHEGSTHDEVMETCINCGGYVER